MRARRNLLACLVTATTATMLAAVLPGSATAVEAEPTYTNYVALGDSYTAGPLIPNQRLDPLGCFRSTADYPALVADGLGIAVTDVSCSGAHTGHMTQAQGVPLGSNAPQLDALAADTDLVTLGIGGNDGGVFGDLISTCPGLRDSDPTGAPCQEHFAVDGADTMMAKVAETGGKVEEVLRQIRERAPEATVLAVGYPRIAPPSGYCPDVLPFAEGDYAWLNDVEEALNTAIADAVAAEGTASFVDTFGPSLGHDACAGDGQAWINGKDIKPLAAMNYHPFRLGMEGMAAEVRDTLDSAVRASGEGGGAAQRASTARTSRT